MDKAVPHCFGGLNGSVFLWVPFGACSKRSRATCRKTNATYSIYYGQTCLIRKRQVVNNHVGIQIWEPQTGVWFLSASFKQPLFKGSLKKQTHIADGWRWGYQLGFRLGQRGTQKIFPDSGPYLDSNFAMGQNPVPPVNLPIPTKIDCAPTPKWYHWF